MSAPTETVNTRGGRVVAVRRGSILLMTFFRPDAGVSGQVAFREGARVLVIGGGYIGLEMGSVYAQLGSTVTVVELAEDLGQVTVNVREREQEPAP